MSQGMYYRDFQELNSALEGLMDFIQLETVLSTTFNATALLKSFDDAFSLPVLQSVDRKALFTSVCRWALEELKSGDLFIAPTAPAEVSWSVDTRAFSAARCRGILANALLGNVMDVMADQKFNKGGLDCSRLGPQKMAALLLYFAAGMQLEGTADDDRVVQFDHIHCPTHSDLKELMEQCENIVMQKDSSRGTIRLHDGSMEDPTTATAFVNFANAQFGYGKFIDSCTQEEILQMCCPEFNVGMLFIGTMMEYQVVVVRRCRRFVAYTGYLHDFVVEGPVEGPVQDILTLDACTHHHFTETMILRDICKAYTAFKALIPQPAAGATATDGCVPVVSTGRWGCGIFGGLPAHKFLQQLVAAQLAGVSLEFSTFSQPESCDLLLAALQDHPTSIAQLWKLLQTCTVRGTFVEDALRYLKGENPAFGCEVQ